MGDTLKTFLEVSDNFNSHMLNKEMYKNTNHTSTIFIFSSISRFLYLHSI